MKNIVAKFYIIGLVFAVGVPLQSIAADWTDADDSTITYTALKSIKGGGSAPAYINTGIVPNGTETVKFKFKPTDVRTSSNDAIFCSRDSSAAQQFAGFKIGSKIRIDRNSTQSTCNSPALSANSDYSVVANYSAGTISINGTFATLNNALGTGDYRPTADLYLYASHKGGESVSNKGWYWLYYFQMYSSGGVLQHNFMPAKRDIDNVIGVYDTVQRKFYAPTGGSFANSTARTVTVPSGCKKWTGLGGADNKMSTGANWEGGVAPQAGDDLDFTLAAPLAEINADMNVTFGKVWIDDGDLPGFTNTLTATAINDLERMTAYDTATEAFTFMLASQDFTWNGGAAENWNTSDASWLCNGADSAWYDHNNAIFDTVGAKATLTADASANSLVFNQNATVTVDGTATLTVPTVSVDPNVFATISAPTAGVLEKTGAGTLTLGSSRTDQTTLSEGTLKMASGATLDLAKLTLGTNPAKPVSLDLGGATINADLTARMPATVGGAAGGTVAIDNGAITNTATLRVWNGWLTLGSGVDVTMNGSDTWVCVGGNNSSDESVTTKDAYLVLDGASIKESVSNPETLLGIGDFGSYPSKGTMIVKNGGSFKTDNSAYVAQGCEGHLVIDGEGSSVTAYQLVFCNAARCAQGENGYVVVTNGGTLVVNRLGYGSGKGEGYFRFDGGTLRAQTKNETLLPAHEKLHYIVGAEGGTIHNGDYDITIAKGLSGPGTINLTGSGTTTFAAGVGAEGGVSVANGTTLTINGTAQSSFGSLTLAAGSKLALEGVTSPSLGVVTLEAGSTIDIATPATDVAAFAATALNLLAEDTVTLTSGGEAFGEGLYAICKMSGVTAEAGEKFAPVTGDLVASWSVVDGDTLMLTVGAVDGNTWTGGANNGNLSDPKNWYGGKVPESGTVTINTTGTLTVGDTFRPDVIVFPETCGAVTIAGDNAIAGLTAITNLSVSTCTFEVPVAFADKICVSQGASYGFSNNNPVLKDGGKVRFAGGVTGMSFAEGTSRRLDGAFTIPATANWTANSSAELWTVTGDSSLTITDSSSDQPASTDLSWLNNNGAFTTAVIRTSSRICLRNEGEYIVTEELAMTLPGKDLHIDERPSESGKYKIEKVTLGDNGNRGNYYMDKNVYIGAGGLCFAEGAHQYTAYAFGRQNGIHIYPWHSDYTIGGKGGSTRDVIILKSTYLHTDDENGVARTVTLNGVADVRVGLTVNGHGRLQVNSNGLNGDGIGNITVTEFATLAYAPGADLGAGAVTVGASATLEVASGVNTFGGGLTLNDGATLSFNFTERTVAPQIAIANGKTLTVNGAVKVKIPADSKWPTAGEKVLTTCGGFTEGNVTLVTTGAPKWAKRVYVNGDGNIVLDVKPMGTRVIVR